MSILTKEHSAEFGVFRGSQKRQFQKERKAAGYFNERYGELDEKKNKAAIKMVVADYNYHIIAVQTICSL
jgi:hypothetical protein